MREANPNPNPTPAPQQPAGQAPSTGPASGGGAPARGRGRGRGRYTPRRKVCQFCVDKVDQIDYKDVARLRRFISDRGKIEPRRKTGTCARHQRILAIALKRARHLALLPFTAEHIREMGGLPPVSVGQPPAPVAAPAGASSPEPPASPAEPELAAPATEEQPAPAAPAAAEQS